jgi:hypothetical protein
MGKLEPFRRAGAQTFMLSFDDVQKVLTHPEDVAAYGQGDEAYGKANGDLLTRFSKALRARDPGAELIVREHVASLKRDLLRHLEAQDRDHM